MRFNSKKIYFLIDTGAHSLFFETITGHVQVAILIDSRLALNWMRELVDNGLLVCVSHATILKPE